MRFQMIDLAAARAAEAAVLAVPAVLAEGETGWLLYVSGDGRVRTRSLVKAVQVGQRITVQDKNCSCFTFHRDGTYELPNFRLVAAGADVSDYALNNR
jgi:hypothetical protein